MRILLPLLAMALLLVNVKCEKTQERMTRDLKHEFSFSSVKNDFKHKYYKMEKEKEKQRILEEVKRLHLKTQQERKVKMKEVFNKVKQSILSEII